MASDDQAPTESGAGRKDGPHPADLPPIVAVGASAGGLEALQELVSNIPEDSGACFVVIQHLAPDHESIMDQLLGSYSHINVAKIEDGATPKPDTVYVIPPGPSATLKDGVFHLHERDDSALRTPIDKFFESVAKACGRDAVCVVLSGTGSDGTAGLRAVKEAGGMAIVQESGSARFPGMPDSAAATGLVDFVLKPADMASCIGEILHHRAELDGERDSESRFKEIEEHLDAILDQIEGDDGPDFGKYKPGTLIRRIDRRLMLRRQRTVTGYISALKREPDERNRLLQDFLIGVTRFFRDGEAFAELRSAAIKPLADSDQESFRIWSPGCSTGEEAYTIAILMIEEMERTKSRRPIKVFGTDIDLAAMRHARAGYYNVGAVADLSEERRERFFRKEEGRYRVTQELRDCVVFAPHNLVEDPPFSRLDLITCRNLLIYLNDRTQANVIPRFHYALNPGGYLMLGASESLGSQTKFFKTIDRTQRIFQRNDHTRPGYSALHTDRTERRRSTTGPGLSTPMGRRSGDEDASRAAAPATTSLEELERGFLSRFAAPFLVADGQDQVVYVSERMAEFVKPKKGAPSTSIDAYLTEALRGPAQTALTKARRNRGEARSENVVVDRGGDLQLVDVIAGPSPDEDGRYFLILRPVRVQDTADLGSVSEARRADDAELLEQEVSGLKQQLSATLVEYEGMEQELRTTNEELLSMNEELQSSNEELETSREELQSINEELETINAELSENNRQLAQANSDLKNLFESTDVATLFLDGQRMVRLFTPKLSELFGVRERDIGRPITDLSSKVHYDQLEEDAREVARTLQPLEREVETEPTGEVYIVRVRPYRTVGDKIDGCVITFFDITERKRNEEQLARNADVLARQYAELEGLYDTTPVGLNLLDKDLRYLRINARLAEINGYPPDDHIGKTQEEMLPEIDEQVRASQLSVLETGEAITGIEVSGKTPASDDERHWIVDYYPVKSRDGEVFAVGSAVREVTEEVRLRAALIESEARIRRLFDAAPVFIALHEGPQHVFTYFNPALQDQIGGRELQGRTYLDALPELEGHAVVDQLDRVYRTGEAEVLEEFKATVNTPDGERAAFYRQILQPWYDAAGQVGGVMSFAFDISDIIEARKNAEESEARKDILLNELQHRVKNTLATTLSVMRFTARTASDVRDMTAKLEERITAISRTHDTLTQSSWSGDRLKALCERQITPYAEMDGGRVRYEGDDPFLSPKQALSLGLALHELTTNAVKHGALKDGQGEVLISVTADAEIVRLRWSETGVGKISQPGETSRGFGSFLLNRVLKAELGGETESVAAEDGLAYDIRFPAAPARHIGELSEY